MQIFCIFWLGNCLGELFHNLGNFFQSSGHPECQFLPRLFNTIYQVVSQKIFSILCQVLSQVLRIVVVIHILLSKVCHFSEKPAKKIARQNLHQSIRSIEIEVNYFTTISMLRLSISVPRLGNSGMLKLNIFTLK